MVEYGYYYMARPRVADYKLQVNSNYFLFAAIIEELEYCNELSHAKLKLQTCAEQFPNLYKFQTSLFHLCCLIPRT